MVLRLISKRGKMDQRFRAGAVQFDIVNGDIQANTEAAVRYLGELADQGACLGVLPEFFSCGFDNENIKAHALKTPETLNRLSEFSRKRKMAIAGTLPQAEGEQVFNTLYFIDRDGRLSGAYQKLHLFRLTNEHDYYAPGSNTVVLDSSLGRIGLMICYDLRFPELARSLFLEGAGIIIVSAQWPRPRHRHWQILTRARAIENQAYVICSNRTGTDGELFFPGLSSIVDPMGQVVAEAGDGPGVISADIDMGCVDEFRKTIPIKEDRRKDVYG